MTEKIQTQLDSKYGHSISSLTIVIVISLFLHHSQMDCYSGLSHCRYPYDKPLSQEETS